MAGAVLVLGACAGTPPPAPPAAGVRPAFVLGRDSFGFANLVRAENPTHNGTFANYCLLMVRAATQFHRVARFVPAAPALDPAEYARRVRAVLAAPAWAPPRAAPGRIEIPGFADLHAFSRAHEPLIKAAFGSSLPSLVHWRTWRVALAQSAEHQAALARELTAEVDAGRPAPLMITNFPHVDLLNHAVLVYDYRRYPERIEFHAYDPNDPGAPLALAFAGPSASFWVGPLPYSPPGRIRAFRLYASPLL